MRALWFLTVCPPLLASAPGERADAVVLVAPVLLDAPELAFPPGAEAADVTVELLLQIDATGAVVHAELVDGPQPFADLALAAAPGLHFVPAHIGDLVLEVEVPFQWTFHPPGAPAAAPAPADAADGPAPEPAPALPAPPPPEEPLVGYIRPSPQAPIVRSLSAAQVASTPGTFSDPVRAVQNLPGTSRTPLDAGWLLVRGGAPQDTGLFLDGIRVPLIYHLGGFTSILPPALIDDVVFLPGGFPVRYGRATAGVAELRTAPVSGPLRADLGADLIAAGALVSVPFGERGGAALSVRRSYLDAVLSAAPGITEQESQIAPRFWDWAARVDLDAYGLLGFGVNDEVDLPSGDGQDTVTLALGTERVQGHASFLLGGQHLSVVPVFSRSWSTIHTSSLDDQRETWTAGGRLERTDGGEGSWGASGGLDVEAGSYRLRIDAGEVGSPFSSVDPYLSVRVGQGRQLLAGVRASTLFLGDQIARVAPDARLAAQTPVGERLTLHADLGLFHQAPSLDLLVGLPAGPYLHLQQSWGGGVGGRLDLGAVSVEVDGYGRRLDRVAIYEDDGTLGEARGAAWGVETLTRASAGRFSGWLSATYARSLRQDEPGDRWLPYTFDQPLVVGLVGAWELGRSWTLASRWRYASGYPTDPDHLSAYDLLTDSTHNLEKYGDRLPAFHALDLKISRRVLSRGWSLDGYLDVQNVYNRRVPEPAITGMPYQDTVFTYGLPVLPIIGVQGHYSRQK